MFVRQDLNECENAHRLDLIKLPLIFNLYRIFLT